MDTLFEVWGLHLDEQAMRLLQKAQTVADTQHMNVNILHVLFVALTDTNLNVYQRFKDVLKSEGLLKSDTLGKEKSMQSLVHEVLTQMTKDALYFRLDVCKLACMEVARGQQIQISDALIVEQIIEKSYSVKRIFQQNQILPAMKKALQTREKSSEPVPMLMSRGPLDTLEVKEATKRVPSGPLNALEVQEVLDRVTIVSPTREDSGQSLLTRLDDALHRLTFDSLLKTLNQTLDRPTQKMVMLCGQNDAVFDQDKLERILAYRLTSAEEKGGSAGSDQPALLAGYQFWQLSLHTLRALYATNPRFHPMLALKHLKQEAKNRRAILLLTELETISEESSVDRRMREQLADLDNTCIVGCYKYYDQPPDDQELRLGLSRDDITIVFDERQPDLPLLHQWIEEYCRQQYPQHSIHLDREALECLLHLEPGIWMYKQRQVFSSLSITILDACITTLIHEPSPREPSPIRTLAQSALVALQDLLQKEIQGTSVEVRKQFQGFLQQALGHMLLLIDAPGLDMHQGRVVITQSLIEAHVFNRQTCEFHFPGHFPWTVPGKS